MRSIIKKSILFAGLAVALSGAQAVYAQCFDMTKLGEWDSFRCLNYDLKIVDRDKEKVTYGWVASKSPDDHPRQTLLTEQGKDGLCAELNVLPPDNSPCIRLASDTYTKKDSAKASVCACYYNVTAENPIVYLRYAAVMHNAGHEIAKREGFEDYAQPNIHINVIRITEEGQEILECPSLAFYPSDSAAMESWNKGTDTLDNPILWKDWTMLPIDMSAYIGERMVLMLTAYDCAESDYEEKTKHIVLCESEPRHQARLYFTIDCGPRVLQAEQTCTKGDSTILTAPEHFTYKWYDKAEPSKTLSTNRVWRFATQADDATYCCEMTGACEPIVLEQFVYAKKIYTDKVSLGYGQTYTWDKNGKTYTHSASVSDTIRHLTTGCDSIIYNLHLSIKADSCYGEFKMTRDTVCADTKNIGIMTEYTVGGMEKYSLLFTADAKKAGFSDVTDQTPDETDAIIIPLPGSDDTDSLTYTRPGTYTFTLVETNTCEETIEHKMSFTILYPSWVIFQRWEDVLSVANETYNGGYNFTSYRWFKNGKEVQGHGSWYNEKGKFDYEAKDEYWVELKRKDDGKAVCSCRFTPSPQTDETTFEEDLSVTPRRNGDSRSLRIATNMSGTYTLYDIWGRSIQSGVFGEDYGSPDIIVNSTCGNGTYMLVFKTQEGKSVTKKLIL